MPAEVRALGSDDICRRFVASIVVVAVVVVVD